MFLGIDLGTSSLKALLVDDAERIVGSASAPLTVANPRPGWSEQDPRDWWAALLAAVDSLGRDHGAALAAVRGIGLCGQMHGAVLLDAADQVLRPCILWNDMRSARECLALMEAEPALRDITGNVAMPGFTAPKLLWIKAHEPQVFAATRRVLLPKAWLRLVLTGEAIEDMSDASGTLWLDVGARRWSSRMLAATGLDDDVMPSLVEGNAAAGRLRADLAARWKMRAAPIVAGGAGDNAAGAIGVGAVQAGSAFVSLGTSGVIWAGTDRFRPYTEKAVHAFCHALPGLWHQMGVTLSAAASLGWWAEVTSRTPSELLAEASTAIPPATDPIFLPYLSGERTPYNDGSLRGRFVELSASTDRAAMTRAIMEGVAFSLRDCLDALRASGTVIPEADVIGGGSRSESWTEVLACALGIPLHRVEDGESGAAFGAARLARLAVTGEEPVALCRPPRRIATVQPDASTRARYEERLARYRACRPRSSADD
ncbi:MAG TPA: xylulokinase [Casimicrobiaceae bacterium]|nr:xylulokinase [Casimicrobiaceae bacterium]